MSKGWISVHRKIIDSPIFHDSQAVHLWLYILLTANHKEGKVMRGNTVIIIPRGSMLTGRKSLSKATGIAESKIQRLLKLFEFEGQIEQQTNSRYRVISVCNYDKHQETEQQTNSKRTATEQQLNTNNNVNNDNNVNNKTLDYSSWPSLPSEQTLKDWLDMRKRLKANVSQTVINNFAKQFQIAIESGHTVDYCLSECVTRNWRGFKAEWIENEKTGNNKRTNLTAVERVIKAGEEQERREREQIDITPYSQIVGEDG